MILQIKSLDQMCNIFNRFLAILVQRTSNLFTSTVGTTYNNMLYLFSSYSVNIIYIFYSFQIILDSVKEDKNILEDVMLNRNEAGLTGLSMACKSGHTETVNALLDYVVSANI